MDGPRLFATQRLPSNERAFKRSSDLFPPCDRNVRATRIVSREQCVHVAQKSIRSATRFAEFRGRTIMTYDRATICKFYAERHGNVYLAGMFRTETVTESEVSQYVLLRI